MGWIFGYGSLMWRPAFDFVERRPAHIEGWARRFWQGSTDHRGEPQAPGRVVTLVPEVGARCTGVAYRVEGSLASATYAQLDHRERGGYERLDVRIHFVESGVDGLSYRAHPDNPNYLGPAPLEEIAQQVAAAHGPSGANLEYVLKLAESLREFGADDPHVFELEALLKL